MLFQYQRLAQPVYVPVIADYGPVDWYVQHPVSPPPPRLRQSEWLADRPLEPSLTTAPPELSWKAIHPDIIVRRPHQPRPDGMAVTILDPSGFVVVTVPEYVGIMPTLPVPPRNHYWYTQQASHLDFMWIGGLCGMQIAGYNPAAMQIAGYDPSAMQIAGYDPGPLLVDGAVCG